MTRFNPDADLVPIEDWEQIAEKKAIETGAAWRIIGGVIAGGVGFALSVEILGIVAGGYLCYSAYERIRRSGKDLKAVRDFGCVAHLLDEQDFRSFAKQFGDKEVHDQITFALDRGWTVSKFAQSWINTYERGQQLQPARNQDNRTLPQEFRSLPRTPNSNAQAFIPPVNTQVATYNPLDDSKIDLIAEMTDRIQNIFGVGQGGSGKGMLLANACRAVKSKHSGKKIFLINGKDDPKEHDYFTGCVDVEKRMHCETAKPATVAAWFEASIKDYDDYAAKNNGALLIIDEGTIIGARLKTAKSTAMDDKIIGITSCGGSTGKNVWCFVQTPFAGGSGSTLSAISQMTSIVLVRADALGVLNQWKRSALFNKFDSSLVAELANLSECNRAVYWGGSDNWYSMPKLTNYSAFDRDSGTFIKDVLTPSEQLEKMLDVSENPTTIGYAVTFTEDLLEQVLFILGQSDKDKMSFNAIRISKIWAREWDIINPTTSELRAGLLELIKREKITGNEDDGYSLANNI